MAFVNSVECFSNCRHESWKLRNLKYQILKLLSFFLVNFVTRSFPLGTSNNQNRLLDSRGSHSGVGSSPVRIGDYWTREGCKIDLGGEVNFCGINVLLSVNSELFKCIS